MERAKRSGGLHKRSAEAWGHPLRRAIGAAPLSGLVFLMTKSCCIECATRSWTDPRMP
jgi:hypothetical protein